VYCRSISVDPDPAKAPVGLSATEEQADAYAAALLMPASLIREQYLRCGRDFFKLCDVFGSSGAAMGRRLHAVIEPGSLG
jgi:hypothetical protein